MFSAVDMAGMVALQGSFKLGPVCKDFCTYFVKVILVFYVKAVCLDTVHRFIQV